MDLIKNIETFYKILETNCLQLNYFLSDCLLFIK